MYQRLPTPCNLEHLRKEAKAVLRVARHQNNGWRLADAQRAVARGYGFASWSKLKTHVESVAAAPSSVPARSEPRRSATGLDDTSRHEHSIAGMWAARRPTSTRSPVSTSRDVMSVVVAGDVVTVTHVTLGPPGEALAQKMAIQADGQEHPLGNDGGAVLHARWINRRVLEMTVKRGGETLGQGRYEVSEDGAMLTVSTPEHVVVYERAKEV